MKLIIYSPETTVYDGEVTLVELPGTKGRFTVLRDHDAVITTLTAGTVRYETDDADGRIEIVGGYAEVKENRVMVCAMLPAGQKQ